MVNRRGRPRHPDILTPAEWRVLEGIQAGRTNPEIATDLDLSVNTVRYHVSNILGKLELRNRDEAREWRRSHRWAWLAVGWGALGKVALGTAALIAAGLVGATAAGQASKPFVDNSTHALSAPADAGNGADGSIAVTRDGVAGAQSSQAPSMLNQALMCTRPTPRIRETYGEPSTYAAIGHVSNEVELLGAAVPYWVDFGGCIVHDPLLDFVERYESAFGPLTAAEFEAAHVECRFSSDLLKPGLRLGIDPPAPLDSTTDAMHRIEQADGTPLTPFLTVMASCGLAGVDYGVPSATLGAAGR